MNIQPYNSKELARLYNTPYKTFLLWLNPIRDILGPQIGRLWNIKQVNIMVEHLGLPN